MLVNQLHYCDFCLTLADRSVARGDDLPYAVCATCDVLDLERVCFLCGTGELVPTRALFVGKYCEALCFAHARERLTQLYRYGEDGANFLADLYADMHYEYRPREKKLRAKRATAPALRNYDEPL